MKIAILFDNLGPYHIARIKALSKLCDLIAIEVRAVSEDYAWRPAEIVPFKRVTLSQTKDDGSRINSSLQEVLSRESPDVLMIPGWSDRYSLEALTWACRNQIPSIVMSASQFDDFKRSKIKEFIKGCIVRRFSAALVGGEPQASYLESFGIDRSSIKNGYNVIDNEHFSTVSRFSKQEQNGLRLQYELPQKYFIVSARFIKKKNLQLLIRAFSKYRKSSRNSKQWDLVLMGDGPLRPELQRQVKELNLQGLVHFVGFRQYSETPIILGLASTLILPSTSEQWGLVVNEGMASGLPILVSRNCGSATDLVSEGRNGYTFDPYDEDGLTSLMIRMSSASSETLQAMSCASQSIISGFSTDRFASNAVTLATHTRGIQRFWLLDALITRAITPLISSA